ncbi:MAG: hypothetical protein ACI8TA_002939, partial [Cyclobacteriaceae bacterium]
MHIITIKLYFVLVIFIFTAKGVSAQVPINLTSTRSAMIISVPDDTEKGFAVRGDWKKIAREAHDSFRKIGIDGVLYIYKDDLTAGPEITKAYNEVLIKRLVSNMISLEITGTDYNLEYVLNIYPVKDAIELNQSAYRVSSKSLNELMLVLGRQVLRQETPRTNFLITDQPEFLDDL